MDGIVWLLLLIVLLIIEIITLGLTTIWFAGGALVAFVASLLGAGQFVQIILFLVVSLVMLAGTRPFAVKYINKDRTKTNAESLVGSIGIVTEDIDNVKAIGTVMLQGQEWTARANDNTTISRDKIVVVKEIQGVKLMVEEQNDMEE